MTDRSKWIVKKSWTDLSVLEFGCLDAHRQDVELDVAEMLDPVVDCLVRAAKYDEDNPGLRLDRGNSRMDRSDGIHPGER